MNTKKKFFYSMGAKALVLIFLFAGIAGLAAGVGMGAKIVDTGVSLEDALRGTRIFQNLLCDPGGSQLRHEWSAVCTPGRSV